jgi:hypothetical protein
MFHSGDEIQIDMYTRIMSDDLVECTGRTADLAGGSLLRSGQTHVGEPKIGEHAQ